MTLATRASSAVTMTLAGLATSSSLTVGRCSAAIDNSTNMDEILEITAQVMTGTSPTASKSIELWTFSELADGTWPDLFTAAYSGSDGGFTIRSREILFSGARIVGVINTGSAGNTSNVPYTFAPIDIAQLLGGAVRKVALFGVHDTGVNLHATGENHVVTLKPYYWA